MMIRPCPEAIDLVSRIPPESKWAKAGAFELRIPPGFRPGIKMMPSMFSSLDKDYEKIAVEAPNCRFR